MRTALTRTGHLTECRSSRHVADDVDDVDDADDADQSLMRSVATGWGSSRVMARIPFRSLAFLSPGAVQFGVDGLRYFKIFLCDSGVSQGKMAAESRLLHGCCLA
jgi:hypothetical protein